MAWVSALGPSRAPVDYRLQDADHTAGQQAPPRPRRTGKPCAEMPDWALAHVVNPKPTVPRRRAWWPRCLSRTTSERPDIVPDACAPNEEEPPRSRPAALLRTEHPIVTVPASAPDGITRRQLDQLDAFNRTPAGVPVNMLRHPREAGLIRCQDNK
ncbi:hypothetical protein OG339_01160 [Streptosporangium sp. NBC_01495]|uniref:hypothetical protein n=1 Tax=Streptosporangium sp. NBC_01495 TaxID=2903899 RepID=UPI002E33BF22|nr:hypothetical protein [Streptosporangium sp. NBC_01495]